MKRPTVDLSSCSLCLGCIEVCPTVFRENAAGYLEVIELDEYPEDDVNDAIKYCPEDCIYWEDS
jgi:ferredoxin